MATVVLPVLLAVTFISAVTNWIAVTRGWKSVEYVVKPATMIFLFAWMALASRFGHASLVFFGLGILFSLAGDIFLMLPERWFIAGLAAFLLAQVMYIVGFNLPLPEVSLLWSLVFAVILGLGAARVLRGIVGGLKARKLDKLVLPVIIYGSVITLMLLSALLTLPNPDWQPWTALLAAFGAFSFYVSDMILAWNKFVTPIKNGRVMNMATYHLGQIALAIAVVYQFAPPAG